MNGGRETLHIFHIFRRDGSSVFLHPFRSADRLRSMFRGADVVGHYGAEPRVESINLLRNELYRRADAEIEAWAAEARFIPRFLAAAGVFLASYLFLAYVFHGVVRLIETLTISSGAAIAVYIIAKRRYRESETVLKRRSDMHGVVDQISFEQSEFVQRIESALAVRETLSSDGLRDTITESVNEINIEGYEDEALQFLECVGALFDSSEFRRAEKQMSRLEESEKRGGSAGSAWRWTESRTLDRPLLSIYFQLKRRVADRLAK